MAMHLENFIIGTWWNHEIINYRIYKLVSGSGRIIDQTC